VSGAPNPSRFLTVRPGGSLSGVSIGDFEIGRQIGRGGMGTVYAARQRSLNRQVAIKVLAATAARGSSAIVRFQREAEAAANLHHPNIVPIFAQGEEDGTYYYAMELLSGRSVDRIIAELRGDQPDDPIYMETALADTAPLTRDASAQDHEPHGALPAAGPPGARPAGCSGAHTLRTPADYRSIAGHVAAVADALHYAHERGIVHRDVKPHNLIFAADGRLCVSDFGLARVLEQPGVTVTGEFLGSPLYMSPEQISGQPSAVGPRSDVYSLGATLYEWLTLRPPFPGTTREQVISLIVRGDPDLPRSSNPQVPVDLETVCLKAMERSSDRRYATAAEFAADLRRFVDGKPIRARRLGGVQRVGRFVTRYPVLTVAAAAILLALALSTALFRQSAKTTHRDRELRERLTAVERENEALAAQAQATLDALQSRVALGEQVGELLKRVPGAEALFGSEDPVAHRVAAMLIGAQREFEHRRREQPGEQVDPASADALYLAGLANADTAAALDHLGRCLLRDPDHSDALRFRATLHCAAQRFDSMAQDAERLLATQADRFEGYFLRGVAGLLSHEGLKTRTGSAMLDAAIADLDRALQLGADAAWVRTLRAIGLARAGAAAAALPDFDAAIADAPDLVLALLGRARARMALNQYEAAAADLSAVIALERRNSDALALRAECYDRLRMFDLAVGDYSAALLMTASPTIAARYAVALVNQKKQSRDAAADVSDPAAPTLAPAEAEEPPAADTDVPSADEHLRWLQDFLRQNQNRNSQSRVPRSSATIGWSLVR